MPEPIHRPLSELELAAAERRRFLRQQETQREALKTGLSIACPWHSKRRGEPCWPGPPEAVCTARCAQALGMRRARLEREARERERDQQAAERERERWAKANQQRHQDSWGHSLPRRAG